MVHYDHPLKAVQPRPPTCPTCGSHRTEVVGRSQDGRFLDLRCNTCGSRVRVLVPAEDERAAPATKADD